MNSLDKIQLSTRHLLELVNDVLDMSKLEADRLDIKEEPFDLTELMNEVAALMDSQVMQTGLVHRKHKRNYQAYCIVWKFSAASPDHAESYE